MAETVKSRKDPTKTKRVEKRKRKLNRDKTDKKQPNTMKEGEGVVNKNETNGNTHARARAHTHPHTPPLTKSEWKTVLKKIRKVILTGDRTPDLYEANVINITAITHPNCS